MIVRTSKKLVSSLAAIFNKKFNHNNYIWYC